MVDLVDNAVLASSAASSSTVRSRTACSKRSLSAVVRSCAVLRSVTSSCDAKKNCVSPASLDTGLR